MSDISAECFSTLVYDASGVFKSALNGGIEFIMWCDAVKIEVHFIWNGMKLYVLNGSMGDLA